MGDWEDVLKFLGRKPVLAAFVTFTTTLAAAIEVRHGPRSLVAAVVVLAALAALGLLLVTLRRETLESRRERLEASHRLRVTVGRVGSIDPLDIGVDAASQTVLPGDRVPEYVAREVDAALSRAVGAAVDGEGRWLVVGMGRSKVGKSRALFEALRRHDARQALELVAPVDQDALAALLAPGGMAPAAEAVRVLWIDDLEPFVGQGMTHRTLDEWRSVAPNGIVVATYGGKGSDLVADSSLGAIATLSGEILRDAKEVAIESSTPTEIESLRGELPNETIEAIKSYGLAAYLVAGPLMQRKLTTGRHGPGEPECHEGVALVSAVVDWARCGRTDGLAERDARLLWPVYLPYGMPATQEAFARAVAWACRPVAGTTALLSSDDGYRPYEYVVRLVREQPNTSQPSDEAWALAIGNARDGQALAVGHEAYDHDRIDDAIAVWTAARASAIDEVAAASAFNVGATHQEFGQVDEALAIYDEIVERYDRTPGLGLYIAKALYNKATVLMFLEGPTVADEIFAYVWERFGEEPAPPSSTS